MLFLSLSMNASATIMSYEKVLTLSQSIFKEANSELTTIAISDIDTFCPSYSTLNDAERMDFFSHLLATLSMYESGFDTENKFVENNGNISTGLLQISLRSISANYKEDGCSIIKTADDLTDPFKNLRCGIAIITSLVKRDGSLAKAPKAGASRYWSTLRAPYTVYIKSLGKNVKLGKRNLVIKDLKKNYPRCLQVN